MRFVLETSDLGRSYGGTLAIDGLNLGVPERRIVGLVGLNGAGKTTLLHLAVGLLEPTAGHIKVLGWNPAEHPTLVLSRVGFLAQNRPLYAGFRVSEMLRFGRELNARWDEHLALDRLRRFDIPLQRRVRELSGGQQAQVALALALAKTPDLLLLDEPTVNLDPLARREFLQELTKVAADGMSIVISSHLVADLERICDYVIVLSAGQTQLAGEIDDLIATHRLLIGPREEADRLTEDPSLVQVTHSERQSVLLVRSNGREVDVPPFWQVRAVPLEDLLLAYMRNSEAAALPAPSVYDTQGVN